MAEDNWKQFYDENPPPDNLDELKSKISEFCIYHFANGTPVVLVTSGGTTVPLEHNTVRFVDNFSAGTRGAASAEYFLKSGFAVLFLHRSKSLEPFLRHMPTSELMESFVSYKNESGNLCLKVEGELCDSLVPLLETYRSILKKNMLLKIQFTSLSSYLHLLHEIAIAMQCMRRKAILYLAAAVSDFYIPQQEMATHKIHSSEALSVTFQLVPKMLMPLVHYWVPEAFVVSFKLETDETILVQKAKYALERYGHKLVIGNELKSRKYRVIFVTSQNEKEIKLSTEDVERGKEIEEIIVEELLKYYSVIKNSEYNRGIAPSSSTTMCSSSETFPEELKRMFRKHTVSQGISSSDVPDDKNNYQIPLKSEYRKPASNGISTENDASEKSLSPKRDGMDCVAEDNLAHSSQNKHVSTTAKNKVLRKCHTCPHCNYTTPSISHLKNHIVVHEEIRPYKCQLCDYTASQAVTLRRHIDAVHYGKKPYKCKHCDYRASDTSNLRKHEAAIHEGKKLHPCPYCDYRTAQSSNVQLHVRAVHERIKPYGCHICDYRSSQNVHLRRHIKTVHRGKVNTAVTKVSSMK